MKTYTAQKMKFSIKDFFSKCDQVRRKFLIENFIFCAVLELKPGPCIGNGPDHLQYSEQFWGQLFGMGAYSMNKTNNEVTEEWMR